MYIVKNKQTGFKQYFSAEDYKHFYSITGMKLIKKGKKFTDTYSVKIIKDYNVDKILSEAFYIFLCFVMITTLILGYIHYSTI